ncbi:hypothetical protein D3C85_1849570 [compost metagenome]
MNQAQRTVQHIGKHRLGLGFGSCIRTIKRQLRELDIPVTEIIPNEVVQETAGLTVLVRVN